MTIHRILWKSGYEPSMDFMGSIAKVTWYWRLQQKLWLVTGDFDEICHQREKGGGHLLSYLQIEAFNEVLIDCELRDAHASRKFFIWARTHGPNTVIMERLDRYTSSFAWRMLYPNAKAQTLDLYHSDHRLILVIW